MLVVNFLRLVLVEPAPFDVCSTSRGPNEMVMVARLFMFLHYTRCDAMPPLFPYPCLFSLLLSPFG